MDDRQLLTFDRFQNKSQALEMQKLLVGNGIDAEIEDDSEVFDPTFAFGSTTGKSFNIKLLPQDFVKAEMLIETLVLGNLDEVDADYYLYTFSDLELKDILAHKDQWSAFDYMFAQKLLRDRGQAISKDELSQIREARIQELATPEKDQAAWIVAGYIFAVLGGLLGIIIGWHLSSFKKTLPNGQRVFAFSNSNRASGKKILILGIVFKVTYLTIFIASLGS